MEKIASRSIERTTKRPVSNRNPQFTDREHLFILRGELIEVGIYNHNLLRIISSLQWRLATETHKSNINTKINEYLATNYNNLLELLKRTQNIHRRLRKRLEKAELQLIDTQAKKETRDIRNSSINSSKISAQRRYSEERLDENNIKTKNKNCTITRKRLETPKILCRNLTNEFKKKNLSKFGKMNSGKMNYFEKVSESGQLALITEAQIEESPLHTTKKKIKNIGNSIKQSENYITTEPEKINKVKQDVVDNNIVVYESRINELHEEIELQRNRAEQMKTAYLDARQLIVKLTLTIELNIKTAQQLALNEAQSWQMKLKEMKVLNLYIVLLS